MKLFNGTMFCINKNAWRFYHIRAVCRFTWFTFLNYAKKVVRYGCETIICILYIDISLKYVLQFMGNVTYLVNLFMFLVFTGGIVCVARTPSNIYIYRSISVHLFGALFRFDVLILFHVLCFHMHEKKKEKNEDEWR